MSKNSIISPFLVRSPPQELEVGSRSGPYLLGLVNAAFMLKLLEARRKKTFGDAAAGGLVIEKVVYLNIAKDQTK